jgi:hypothetical protein
MIPALVIGSADCVLEDIANLVHIVGAPLEDVFDSFAVNDGGVLWPWTLDHWCTIHPDEMPEREKRRAAAGGDRAYRVWAPEDVHPDYRIDGLTSAGLATGVAHYLAPERKIVWIGCPFSKGGYAVPHMNHGTGPWPYWRTYMEALPAVLKRHPWITEYVRSMSGPPNSFTREKLGTPTKEWIWG